MYFCTYYIYYTPLLYTRIGRLPCYIVIIIFLNLLQADTHARWILDMLNVDVLNNDENLRRHVLRKKVRSLEKIRYLVEN